MNLQVQVISITQHLDSTESIYVTYYPESTTGFELPLPPVAKGTFMIGEVLDITVNHATTETPESR